MTYEEDIREQINAALEIHTETGWEGDMSIPNGTQTVTVAEIVNDRLEMDGFGRSEHDDMPCTVTGCKDGHDWVADLDEDALLEWIGHEPVVIYDVELT
jgi:hypothetical protein